MPLLTDNLDQARRAYEALEARARSAEARAERLEAHNASLAQRILAIEPSPLPQRILDLEAETFTLRARIEQLASIKADLPLQHFIDSVALAAAVGEASMPERAIPSIKVEVRTYLAPSNVGIGVRFPQPELGPTPTGLSSTSFEVVKVPPRPGVAAPPNFYVVLQDTQRIYSDEFWLRFEQTERIVASATRALSNVGAWDALYLVHTAADLAQLHEDLAGLIAHTGSGAAAENYASAAVALRSLTDAQRLKANIASADIYALTSALASTTSAARTLMS